jgi:hypothetical protein
VRGARRRVAQLHLMMIIIIIIIIMIIIIIIIMIMIAQVLEERGIVFRDLGDRVAQLI